MRTRCVLFCRLRWLASFLVTTGGLTCAHASQTAHARLAPTKQAELDRSYAKARWKNGEVYWRGAWRSQAEIATAALANSNLEKYQELRERTTDHRAVARWCTAHRLESEARVHWLSVLERKPDDREAIRNLGLRRTGGELLTAAEIKRRTQHERSRQAAAKRWSPIVSRWRRTFESAESASRQAVFIELRALRDVAALPTLERVFSERGGSETLQLETVKLLGGLRQQAATQSLIRHALFARNAKVRDLAIAQLESRPAENYLPLLFSMMIEPVEQGSGSDGFSQFNYYYRRGITEDACLIETDATGGLFAALAAMRPGSYVMLSGTAAVASAQINQAATRVNRPIQDMLMEITAESLDERPSTWWRWWYAQQGSELPESVPVTYQEVQTVPTIISPHSCFAAGTPIWTLCGQRPIESLRPGDQVLAQDPASGELSYKPILKTTVQNWTKLVRLRYGNDSILVTPGHPVWVCGSGWRTVKNLEEDHSLYCLHGPTKLHAVEPASPDTVFNLVVADFGDYFVGTEQLLVHDNSIVWPADALVPGEPVR